MIQERESISTPEQWFRIYRNANTNTHIISAGSAVCLDLGNLRDGVRVTQPDSGNLTAFVGVADEDAQIGADFRVQFHGWRYALVYGDVTGAAIGDVLVPAPGAFYLIPSGSGIIDGSAGFAIAADVVPSLAAPALYRVHLRLP